MRRTVSALLGVVLAGALVATPSVTTALAEPSSKGSSVQNAQKPLKQWRSYWVDSFNSGIYTPAQADALIADAQAVNANVLIVQVGRWQDCFCNRSSYPKTHVAVDPPPYDPLDTIIDKAHEAGLQVHAWVNVAPMWHLATAPPQADHVFNTHGPNATGPDRWLNKRYDGAEVQDNGTFTFMDPGNPAAAEYMVKGVTSIAKNYDVDGMNLDFIRYPDYSLSSAAGEWGYSDTALARFRALTGRTDTPVPSDPQWSQWRRDQVSNIVRRIYLGMAEAKPKARLSIDGIVYEHGPSATPGGWEGTRTYKEVMQDWRSWLDEGILDTVVAMNYKRELNPDHVNMYREWNEYLKDHQYGRQNVVGPAIYLNTIPNSVIQAREALKPSAAGNTLIGWSGYSYAAPTLAVTAGQAPAATERPALAAALTTTDPLGEKPVFADKAVVPRMDWKESPKTGAVVGSLKLHDGTPLDQVSITARNVVTGQKVTGRLTDGTGWFGFVDLRPGTWLIEAKLPKGVIGKHLDAVQIKKGKVAKASLSPLFKRH